MNCYFSKKLKVVASVLLCLNRSEGFQERYPGMRYQSSGENKSWEDQEEHEECHHHCKPIFRIGMHRTGTSNTVF